MVLEKVVLHSNARCRLSGLAEACNVGSIRMVYMVISHGNYGQLSSLHPSSVT